MKRAIRLRHERTCSAQGAGRGRSVTTVETPASKEDFKAGRILESRKGRQGQATNGNNLGNNGGPSWSQKTKKGSIKGCETSHSPGNEKHKHTKPTRNGSPQIGTRKHGQMTLP